MSRSVSTRYFILCFIHLSARSAGFRLTFYYTGPCRTLGKRSEIKGTGTLQPNQAAGELGTVFAGSYDPSFGVDCRPGPSLSRGSARGHYQPKDSCLFETVLCLWPEGRGRRECVGRRRKRKSRTLIGTLNK